MEEDRIARLIVAVGGAMPRQPTDRELLHTQIQGEGEQFATDVPILAESRGGTDGSGKKLEELEGTFNHRTQQKEGTVGMNRDVHNNKEKDDMHMPIVLPD